jgi:hypothetical protein
LVDLDTCRHRPYRLTAELPQSTPLFRERDGTCESHPSSAADQEVWQLEELPLSEFVAMERVSRDWHPAMSASVRQGEDGSWEVMGFVDPERDSPCFALSLQVVPHACVPAWASPSGSFSDADCSSRLASVGASRCVAWPRSTLLNLKPAPDACLGAATFELWELGETREVDFVYADDGSGTCTEVPIETTEVFTEGPAIDIATLPALDVVEVGTGPLRLRFHGFQGTPFVPDDVSSGLLWGPFFEAASGETCQPHTFADGSTRCVPLSYLPTTEAAFRYESPACDGERLFPWSAAGDCAGSTPEPRGVLIRAPSTSACSSASIGEVLEFDGTVVPAGTLYHKGGTGCAAAGFSTDPLFIARKSVKPADVFIEIERAVGD